MVCSPILYWSLLSINVRLGHTFVPSTVPAGTLLYHSRQSFDPPPSPEFFAFDVDHSYIFCWQAPCVMYTYVASRDLKLGYFDGTSAAILDGPRDLQDIASNGRFITRDEYNPWVHAISMCNWAKQVGLDGIARCVGQLVREALTDGLRMEPSLLVTLHFNWRSTNPS